MPKAMWNGEVLAEANDDQVRIVEGNVYFPPDALKMELFQPSDTVSTCPWKGKASYYSVSVGGKVNADAAWMYRTPLKAAEEIANHVAFWKGVEVTR